MKVPRFTLVTDGTTDGAMLVPILEWLLQCHWPNLGIQVVYADVRSAPRPIGSLIKKIEFALTVHPCECLLIHRDAEKATPDARHVEVREAIEALKIERPEAHICVVPVRMSVAWLLLDEQAIRRASGNPNGRVRLEIPRRSNIENLADPKRLLYNLLTAASELEGRRRQSFDPRTRSRRVAELIDDFSGLRELSAFQTLERDVRRMVEEKRWSTAESGD